MGGCHLARPVRLGDEGLGGGHTQHRRPGLEHPWADGRSGRDRRGNLGKTGSTPCFVPFCAGVRGGAAFGSGDVSLHRHRGVDPSVGGRRRRDAGGAGCARRGVAHGDRGARRFLVQPHRGWRRGRVRLAEVRRRRRRGRAAATGIAGADGDRDRRSGTAGRGLLRDGAQPRGTGDGRRPRRSDPGGRLDGGSARWRDAGQSGRAAITRRRESDHGVSTAGTGTATEFPPLRTLDPTPGNLRPPGTSLVGREAEVVEIAPTCDPVGWSR